MSQEEALDTELVELLLKHPSALTIYELLRIPFEDRKIQHCKEIIKHVKDVKFLEQYLYTDEIYDLAKEFRIKNYGEKEFIFKQGETGDAFYIILQGSVKVFINIPSEVKHFTNTKEIMTLQKGDAFGELALLYDSVRSATIATNEPTAVIILDKQTFRKHIKDVKTSHLSSIIDFFKNFPGFQGLTQNEIAKLAGKAILQRFPTNTVIVRQDDDPSEVYYIKSGRLKVIRRIDYKTHPITKQIIHNAVEGPTKEDYEAGNFKSELLEIDELSNGDSFCDSGIIKGEKMHHTIVSTIPCELIYITAYDFKVMFDMPFFNQYEGLCKPYPEDFELRKLFQDMKAWANFKKKMTNNVIVEKYNRKIGFDNILRSPVRKMDKIASIGILQRDPSPVFKPPAKSNLLEPVEARINSKGSSSVKNLSKERTTGATGMTHHLTTGGISQFGNTGSATQKSMPAGKSYYNHKFEFVKPLHKLKPMINKKDTMKESLKEHEKLKVDIDPRQKPVFEMPKTPASPTYSVFGKTGSQIVSQP